jgi:predicted PurR-regulated permease PerM
MPVCAVDGIEAERRNSHFVAHCKADSALAQIQSQYPHDKFDVILPHRTAASSDQPRIDPIFRIAVPLIALGVLLFVLYFGRVFFITSIIAVICSFLLDPFVQLLLRFRFPRSIAALLVCTVAGLFVYAIGMAIFIQASGFVSQLPQISDRTASIAERVRERLEQIQSGTFKLITRQPAPAPPPKTQPKKRSTAPPAPILPPAIQEVRIHQDSNPILDFLYPRLSSLYEFLLMASFVPFLVYFILSWGAHINRAFLQFFKGEDRVIASKSLQGIGEMVRAFVVGNSMLGVMLALASTLSFWMIAVPFPLLAGPLSGFLSLFPYVGLPMAVVPPLVSSMAGGAGVSSAFLIVVVVSTLHLLALNLLYPKVVGARVHLNPLIVTFSLMFWSFMWDAAGLLLAIPITAGLKAVCDNVRALRTIGRFLGD